MVVPRKPKSIYFKNGNSTSSKDLACFLAIAEWELHPEEIIRYIDRGLTTRTALQQLLLSYDEETAKKENSRL